MKKLILAPNLSIAYREIDGKAEKPVLVFLHEGLGAAALWKTFPDLLCEKTGCPGLLYDRPGYGESSPISERFDLHFMHHHALCELPAIFTSLIPTGRRIILIGHSDGGSIALIHASENKENLLGVITEAAHVFVEELTVASIRSAVTAFRSGALEGLRRYHGDKTDDTFLKWSNVWLSPGFFHWNIEYALPSISCPVLAIQGKEDPYGTNRQVEAILSRVDGPSEKVLLDACGHTPHRDQPALTLEAMTEFISRRMDEMGN
jgi:pimeloyl-ACP methyl ester carboxylesterase